MSQIYINLPVADLPGAVAFYSALGFVQNTQFSDTNGSAMNWDTNLTVMLLTHDFCRNFLPASKIVANSHQTCEVLNALQCDSKEQVDKLFEQAIQAGGQKTIDSYDHGWMYGRDFQDLDGHIWELFWMDVSQIPTS